MGKIIELIENHVIQFKVKGSALYFEYYMYFQRHFFFL